MNSYFIDLEKTYDKKQRKNCLNIARVWNSKKTYQSDGKLVWEKRNKNQNRRKNVHICENK